MFFGGQQYAGLMDRPSGRRRSARSGDDPPYHGYDTAIGLPEPAEHTEPICSIHRNHQLQGRIVVAVERDRSSVPLNRRRARSSHRVERDRWR